MFNFIIGFIIFSAGMLVLLVLAQNSKGGGLSSQFGGSGASNIMGVKKTGDLLERLTWGFVIAIMVLSLSTNFVSQNTGARTNEILERAGEQAPATALPSIPSTEDNSAQDSTGQ